TSSPTNARTSAAANVRLPVATTCGSVPPAVDSPPSAPAITAITSGHTNASTCATDTVTSVALVTPGNEGSPRSNRTAYDPASASTAYAGATIVPCRARAPAPP